MPEHIRLVLTPPALPNAQTSGYTWFLFADKSVDWIYIDGFNLASAGAFVSRTGANLTYTNWQSGQPDIQSGVKDCINMATGNGLWNNILCDSKRPAVCEIEGREFIIYKLTNFWASVASSNLKEIM